MTERDLQLAVYHYRRCVQPFPILLTNIYWWNWESDVLYITKDGYLQEFEIKLTHSDFLADRIKDRKHLMMTNGGGPSRFWYVCPPDVIQVDELPPHAGLLYSYAVGEMHYSDEPDDVLSLRVARNAPRRKTEPIPERRWKEVAGKAVDRRWSIQLEMIRRLRRERAKRDSICEGDTK